MLTEKQTSKVIKMYNKGKTLEKIVKKVGCTIDQVETVIYDFTHPKKDLI
jgi:DNA-directed RNA polymerase subunit L